MTNLYDFCNGLVLECRGSHELITEAIIAALESADPWEQKLAWDLMRQAGHPFYSRLSFEAAARLAVEIVAQDDGGPEAA